MAINYEQLQKATYQDFKNNPELRRVFGVAYFGTQNSHIADRITEAQFNQQIKPNTLESIGKSFAYELGKMADGYANWNNPQNPVDQKAAFAEREKALKEYQNVVETWKGYGFDMSSVPQVQKVMQTFGDKPGAGITSEQAATMPEFGGMTPEQRAASSGFSNPFSTVSPEAEAKYAAEQNIKSGYVPGSVPAADAPGAGDQSAVTPSSPAQGAGGTQIPDIGAQRARLQALGIDVSALDDSQIGTLYMMNMASDLMAEKNKNLIPKDLTPQDMEKFLADAQTELAPYYGEQFDIAKANLMNTVSTMSGDFSYQMSQAEDQYAQALEAQAKQAAETGLARSGIRQQAEARMAKQQEGIVTSMRRNLQDRTTQLGQGFEELWGPKGVEEFTKQTAGTPLPSVTPIGVDLGKIPGQQVVAEQQRAQQLGGELLGQRVASQQYTYGM